MSWSIPVSSPAHTACASLNENEKTGADGGAVMSGNDSAPMGKRANEADGVPNISFIGEDLSSVGVAIEVPVVEPEHLRSNKIHSFVDSIHLKISFKHHMSSRSSRPLFAIVPAPSPW